MTPMKQIHFFAVKGDLLPVLEAVERQEPLTYIRMGQTATSSYERYRSGAEIPDLGTARTDSASSADSFLVTRRNALIQVRPIRRADSVHYAIDQLLNPHSIVFAPGGTWHGEIILNGRVATVSDSAPARDLMKRFNSAFSARFYRVKAFLVGPEALALLNAGHRLTASAQSPKEYDLTKDP